VHHSTAIAVADENTFTQAPTVAPARVPGETVTPPPKPLGLDALNDGPVPNWIWGAEDNQTYILRKTFTGTAQAAWLRASCDNRMKVFVNGQPVAESGNWQ